MVAICIPGTTVRPRLLLRRRTLAQQRRHYALEQTTLKQLKQLVRQVQRTILRIDLLHSCLV
jgi:hypothetical protein